MCASDVSKCCGSIRKVEVNLFSAVARVNSQILSDMPLATTCVKAPKTRLKLHQYFRKFIHSLRNEHSGHLSQNVLIITRINNISQYACHYHNLSCLLIEFSAQIAQ